MKILFASFTPEWAWLSNFHLAPIKAKDGKIWPSTEHMYQAAKSRDEGEMEEFRLLKTPKEVKAKAYKVVHPRENFQEIKLDLMRRITLLKYQQHEDLRGKLLDTGDSELVHTAPWGDTFWGVCKGQGENWQGKIIMEVRTILQEGDAA